MRSATGVNVKSMTPQNRSQNAVRLKESDHMGVKHPMRSNFGAAKKEKRCLHLFCAVRIELIQNEWAQTTLQRIACDLNGNAV